MKTFAAKISAALHPFLFGAFGATVGVWLAPQLDIKKAFAEKGTLKAVSTERLELVDAQGNRRILVALNPEGAPGIWFFDKKGKARMNLGLYPDGNSFVVLNDEKELAVQILRTVGKGSSPVLVMKSSGQDRLITGLNEDEKSEPFSVYYDAKGTKKTVFGTFR